MKINQAANQANNRINEQTQTAAREKKKLTFKLIYNGVDNFSTFVNKKV